MVLVCVLRAVCVTSRSFNFFFYQSERVAQSVASLTVDQNV
jgi:hypothetical protein